MPARGRKAELKPHTEFIIDLLARFKSHEEICRRLVEVHEVDSSPADILPFTAGKYPKMIQKRTAAIVAALPIVKSGFRLMMLNDLVQGEEATSAEKLSAIRTCTAMLKKEDLVESAEELLRSAE